MHNPITLSEARAIAAVYDLAKTEEAFLADITRANECANEPMEPVDSAQYRRDYANSYRTGLRDPRELVHYWYVQEAMEHRLDDLAAADHEYQAFGSPDY